jgi:hypothetical protein
MDLARPTHLRLGDMPPELQDPLRPRVERLGYLGELFERAAHQPEALAAFYRWTESLKTALPFRIVEAFGMDQRQALAVAAVRPLRRARVFGRDRGRLDAFAERLWSALDIDVDPDTTRDPHLQQSRSASPRSQAHV